MKMWRELFPTVALTFVLCLTGLALSGEAQAHRFTDNGNGTVTDTVTGLMWTKDANPFGKLNWDDAMSRCSSFSISGIGGWRLPSRDELVALHHAIQGEHRFTLGQSWYWSSTTYELSTYYAWLVSMHCHSVSTNFKTATYHVWPVRSAQ